ncbi:hypothetical protein pb186bvf_002701 [Paramecium bursaria]
MGCCSSREQEEKSADDESFFNYLNLIEGSLKSPDKYETKNPRAKILQQLLETNSSNYYIDSNIQSTYQSPREGIDLKSNLQPSKGILKKRFMINQVRIEQQRVMFNIQNHRKTRYRSNSQIQ